MSEPIEQLNKEDLDLIREIGSRIIRNLSLFMDNPFSYAHLISICEQDINNLHQIRSRCGLKGDGLLPAHPLGQATPDLASTLLDAGFARLRSVVDDMIHSRPEELSGENNE